MPVGLIGRDMADLFDRLFAELPEQVPRNEEWVPRLDVEESEKGLVVKVDLPGIDPREVDVSVEEGMLVIKGEKKEEKTVEEKNLRRRERLVGKFYRALTLPPGADPEGITAGSQHGVMVITIPRKPELKPRKIVVQDG
jgi:HSP20 family protein